MVPAANPVLDPRHPMHYACLRTIKDHPMLQLGDHEHRFDPLVAIVLEQHVQQMLSPVTQARDGVFGTRICQMESSMSENGERPPPPWGYSPATPAPAGKPRKYQSDHGKKTAVERHRRYRENKKAERQANLEAARANREEARARAIVGTAHELLPRNKTQRETALANLSGVGRWKPGQSGNPKGMQGARLYIEAQRICRDASPQAALRMVELMGDPDTRVAYMATNMILERAWGKPREYDPATDPENQVRIDVRRLTDEERGTLRKLMQQAVAVGARSDEEDPAD